MRTESTPHPMPIPKPLTLLIGREEVCCALSEKLLLPQVRLLTLTGTGGVGKTRVALAVAHTVQSAFVDGVYFVSLAVLRDPALALTTLAQALGQEIGTRSPFAVIRSFLSDKQILLVLDNMEHLLSAAPPLTALLAICPGLKVLVTSRERLHVEGEYEWVILPLRVPRPDQSETVDLMECSKIPSVQLFVERAKARRSDFALTKANLHTVAEICVRLDGLPLALELAAARLSLFSPQTLLARLSRRLELLTGGNFDLPERQQTLRQTIQWSYDLLSEGERRLFRRLCVFIGGCTLEAIEAQHRDPGNESLDVLEGIASLIDKSLIQPREECEADGRLLILETIREFGFHHLQTSGELAQVLQRHAQYYLDWAEEHSRALYGPEQASCLQQFVQELGNLRAAMQYLIEQQDKVLASRFGVALGPFWLLWGYHHHQVYLAEGKRFLEQVLALGESPLSSTQAQMLSIYGVILTGLGEGERGEACCREALALLREAGELPSLLSGLWMLTQALITGSDYLAARQASEEALTLARKYPQDRQERSAIWTLGYSLFLAGHVAAWNGCYVEARELLSESLAHCTCAGDRFFATWCGLVLGQIAALEGRADEAHSWLEESQKIFSEMGMRTRVAAALRSLGGLALQDGKIDEAYALLRESRQLGQDVNDLQSVAWAQITLAKVESVQNHLGEARRLLEEALEAAIGIGDRFVMAASLDGLGGIVAAQGELVQAVRMWGKAEALREAIGTPIFPSERPAYAAWIAGVRAMLGNASFESSWRQGRDMTPQQACSADDPTVVSVPQMVSSPDTRRRSLVPGSLTNRELDVLCLLAEGLTNRQIAEQLVLSVVTVNAHVRSIYNKMEVSTRTAALRRAQDLGIL